MVTSACKVKYKNESLRNQDCPPVHKICELYKTVSDMRFPNPENMRNRVESCTSAWPFSIFEI